MEPYIPTGKTLDELVKETDKVGAKLILVGGGGDYGKYAQTLAKLAEKELVAFVRVADLPKEDQARVDFGTESRPLPFDPEPFIIKPLPQAAYEPVIDIHDNKQWYEKFPKKRGKR
jgi:hypothetical protein